MLRAFIRRYSQSPSGRPFSIKLRRAEKALEVDFDDGSKFRYPAELLRVKSPAANSTTRVVAGRRHVGIMEVEPVGNYAIRLTFDDLHATGIYSWDYLYNLGQHKYSHMKAYLQELKKQRLTREPSKRSSWRKLESCKCI